MMDPAPQETTPTKPKTPPRHYYWGLVGILLLGSCVIGAALVRDCRHTDPHVIFRVDLLRVSPDGRIEIRLAHQDRGPNRCNLWLKTDEHEQKIGSSAKSIWDAQAASSWGSSANVFQTDQSSSVRLLVKQGESFILKPGMKKTVLQFISQGPDPSPARFEIDVLSYKEMLSEKKP